MPHAQLLLARLLHWIVSLHFSIKGKTSVTFPNFPSARVIKFLESLSIFTCISSRGISKNEFVTATALPEELIDFVLYFISKWSNLSFSRSVWRRSWWNVSWFFLAEDSLFFFGCLSFLFFLELASSWAFFFISLISSLFHLFRASLWRLFASSDLFQLKKKLWQIIKLVQRGWKHYCECIFFLLSLSSVLSFFFVFLSFLSFSDNFNYNCYQLSIHHVPSNERAGLSTLELVKSGKSNFT